MNKKIIEYIIIAIAVVLLIYGSYFFITYHYEESELTFDSITMLAPSSSNYTTNGNTIEFKNPTYSLYNLNVTKSNSSDVMVKNLVKAYLNYKGGNLQYLNESCYVMSVEFAEGGYAHHALIIPTDSFDKDSGSLKNDSTVWIFDGYDKQFVIDSAFNSVVKV